MSDEREQDAAVIKHYHRHWLNIMKMNKDHGIADTVMVGESQLIVALYRTIDRLTAERDQAREQLAKLRAACE